MSDYTRRSSYWQGKDSLSDSDPEKIISGDDFDDEFELIETAVNTKADLNGDAGESFSAITASAGTNTTQVATTEFVTTAVANAEAFPVGSVFISVVSTDPATLLGYGTWSAFAQGKMLVGIDSGDTDFDTVEETGGSKTHTLTESEMPSHTHFVVKDGTVPESGSITSTNTISEISTQGGSTYQSYALRPAASGTADNGLTSETGGDTAHDIMNPYIVTYMWKRTA